MIFKDSVSLKKKKKDLHGTWMAQNIYTYKVEILNLKKKKKYSLPGIWWSEGYNLWL